MHKRHNAQRQHLIHSLDNLLFQLHTLSFFLSPLLLSFVCRLFCQLQCSKPRDTDPNRSLRFWFLLLLFLNLPSFWWHATEEAVEGRTVILDFVGLGYIPSKLHLLLLDILILFLQLVLTTIAYESSLYLALPSTVPENLLPHSTSTPSTPDTPERPKFSYSDPTYVIDLRLTPILNRLRNPPPVVPETAEESLPLPNTMQWPLSVPFGFSRRERRSGRDQSQQTETGNLNRGDEDVERTVPGGIDVGQTT
ncbi:hypothetical protein SERLA73DRAFT_180177 [Serpula lacrymans var. lacrymans S7.3]|uniref:DUF1746 domain-containing protein n=2 Tax=Serpula lacrymans var. lacrymans TaxID=341189 RepID=F8PW34_SERL3|nr:uncharacterized protein SERLADRAFT_465659 [Serpula lacrymans var. lacrymans S7.9]EGN99893.1 hypothetical protein SERLA73DRAFT_180177 [Serpula lacrymans var. lacrymans S7.3]EGO25462.1 hypothetical protein SERLADRAFT_465659 [Serpula lacrymans var. lacrymans S7.9]